MVFHKGFHTQKIVKFNQTPYKSSDPIEFGDFIKN